MFFTELVKKYAADFILLIKFKKVIGVYEKLWRNQFHLRNFYSKPKRVLVGFMFEISRFTFFLSE